MRVLAATIGALLISVSHTALAQEHHGGPPQGELQQGEVAQTERQCPETCRPELELQQDEPAQPLTPMPERQAESADAQPPAMTAEQLVEHLPEARPAETAEMPRPAMTAGQLVAQLPEARPAETAEMQRPVMTAEQLVAQLPEARATGRAEMPRPAMTAEQLVAQLPGQRPAKAAEMQPPAITAEQLVARLPDPESKPTEMDELRQPEAMKAEMQQEEPVQTDMPRDPQWTPLKEKDLGTTMDLPRAMFSTADGHAHKRVGRKYKTPDGRAKVAVWTQHNTRHDTPAGYLSKTFRIPRGTVDYERFTADFAAVSGVYGRKVFYIRCNLSSRDGTFHCFDLAYPVREKKAWDGIVTRMSLSLRPLYQ